MKYQKEIEIYKNKLSLIYQEYSLFLDKSKVENKETFGVCIILLNSVFELFDASVQILKLNHLESGGSLITALWERARTLEFILNNPEERTKIYLEHSKLKKSPWTIKQIVDDIIECESHPTIIKNNQQYLLYVQYSFLSAIKHGNPFTLTSLRKFSNIENIKKHNLNTYLITFAINTVIECFQKFIDYFCLNELSKDITLLNQEFTKFMMSMDIIVPQIITANESEFKPEFWEYLQEITEKMNK